MQDKPWLDNYPSDVPKTLEPYPEESLFHVLAKAASRHPTRPATSFFGKRMNYSQLLAETERFSSVLSGLGVSRGDRVALVLPNCPQYVIGYYAAVRLGATVVGNNPLYTEREMAHQLGDCGPRVTVTLANFYRQVSSVAKTVDIGEVIVTKLTDYMPFPINVLAPMDEADETVLLTLSSPSGAALGAPSTATLTIADDDMSADLAVSVAGGVQRVMLGKTIGYTVTVTNNGPSAVLGAAVSDTLPDGLVDVTWTCTPSTGAQCTASGAGDIADHVNLSAGASVMVRVSSFSAPGLPARHRMKRTWSVVRPRSMARTVASNFH